MQRYTIFFTAVNALHVSGSFPPIIRSSNCTYIWYMSSLLAATASVGELEVSEEGNMVQLQCMFCLDSRRVQHMGLNYKLCLRLLSLTKQG